MVSVHTDIVNNKRHLRFSPQNDLKAAHPAPNDLIFCQLITSREKTFGAGCAALLTFNKGL
jgi:hypothetical protein